MDSVLIDNPHLLFCPRNFSIRLELGMFLAPLLAFKIIYYLYFVIKKASSSTSTPLEVFFIVVRELNNFSPRNKVFRMRRGQ